MDDLFKALLTSGAPWGVVSVCLLWVQGWRFKREYETMEIKLEESQKEKFEDFYRALAGKASLEKSLELEKDIAEKASSAQVKAVEKSANDKIASLEKIVENENREIRKSLTMIFDKINALCSKVDGALERMKDVQTLNDRLNNHIEKGDRRHG